MVKINVVDYQIIEGEEGKKLVHVLEDNGVDILHRCGGNAKCTSCRVEVIEGDFGPKSEQEQQTLANKGFTDENLRLSCQIRVNGDATVKPVMTKTNSNLEPGPRPVE
ncbi:(2Fe-2S)-binding protein [Anaerobacillus alkaliphilus]|uniref:(2Fe-2S)-binding protein n=1 Tax=Anaerobacillus alkaliphilus TaxID=1548597 RepID=A0A4Q0VPI0_9BACI|nr:2Fe-2S iron-sulfur cluster-binding protein [Anaerobacillus alkaliphilus]RXI97815.1 (2Fe-2S)-binding protein [Anaerobacillus alkaliphilus]